MSVPTTFATLQAKVVDLLHRTGDTDIAALAPDWIGYAESELQTRLKLLEFEASASVPITAGSGTLPADYVGMRSVYWDADTDTPLDYLNADAFDALRNLSNNPAYYTVTGSTIKVTPTDTGTLVMTYLARFAPLSDANTSNAILATYPDLYVYGAMKHANVWTGDDAAVQKFGAIFNAVCDRINQNNEERKYGSALAVRAR